MSVTFRLRAEYSTRQRITKVNYFTLQTKKVCGDECHISATCRIEYELKNDRI